MSAAGSTVAIVGGGLAGNLAAIMLARRGFAPTVYERAAPHDSGDAQAGRTINLALAARGIRALQAAGVFAAVEPLLLPMSGRIVHDAGGGTRLLRYGQRPDERIWSVSRAELNLALYRHAVGAHGVDYRFRCECIHYDAQSGLATMRNAYGEFVLESRFLLAADGAGSVVRRGLAEAGAVEAREDLLDHGYKEIAVPPAADGRFALDPDGLHIWPRGGFMLIALPNRDQSFTATLFLPREGPVSFASIESGARDFFAREFADALALVPDLEAQLARNPLGLLGTIQCRPWRHTVPDHHCLLLGDAAHAIVPFHGQGINAGFEDCLALDGLIAAHGDDWEAITRGFEFARLPNTDAIARMALENYTEMRDGVRDPAFERKKALGFELERLSGGRFVPRYSLVMFHPEIGYEEAERRGRIQDEILRRATAGPEDDVTLALALIGAELGATTSGSPSS